MNEIIVSPTVELVQASDVPALLQQIRPAWQAKDLINRVYRLIPALNPRLRRGEWQKLCCSI